MNNLINDLFNIIDITLIDLNEDKVYLYDKYTENPSSISYEDVKKVFIQIMQILILMK